METIPPFVPLIAFALIGIVMSRTMGYRIFKDSVNSDRASQTEVCISRVAKSVSISNAPVDVKAFGPSFDFLPFLVGKRPRCSGVVVLDSTGRENKSAIPLRVRRASIFEIGRRRPLLQSHPTISDNVIGGSLTGISHIDFDLSDSSLGRENINGHLVVWN